MYLADLRRINVGNLEEVEMKVDELRIDGVLIGWIARKKYTAITRRGSVFYEKIYYRYMIQRYLGGVETPLFGKFEPRLYKTKGAAKRALLNQGDL